jgi:hypothetical protein
MVALLPLTVDVLGNQVHAMVQMLFPNNDAILQDDSLPMHTARSVQSWSEEHENVLQHLPWPAQLPHLNIIELLWSVLVSMVRITFPPSSVKQPEDVLGEEWYSIPLQTVQTIPRRIQAVLQTNDDPTPY